MKLPSYLYSFRYGRNLARYLEEGWQGGDWSIPNKRIQQREGVANAKIFSSYSGYEVMPSLTPTFSIVTILTFKLADWLATLPGGPP